jgi:hypothetical protein
MGSNEDVDQQTCGSDQQNRMSKYQTKTQGGYFNQAKNGGYPLSKRLI